MTKEQKSQDIIDLILIDHEPLKKLLKIMKNSDKDMEERWSAFQEFTPLLVAHAKAEEQVLYTFLKEENDMREEGFEGDVEHALAEQTLNEAKATDGDDLRSARIKVLAELVEHHIKEEEEDMLPDFKKNSTKEDRLRLGEEYLAHKDQVQTEDVKPTIHKKSATEYARH